MKTFNTIVLIVLMMLSNITFSQTTKVISDTEYNSDFGTWVTIKKRVIDKSPYLKHGTTELWAKGNLIYEENYKNGELDGETKQYLDYDKYCNGKPIKITGYKDGKEIYIKEYSCDDATYHMKNERYYTVDDVKYREVLYYKDGSKKSEENRTGLCSAWYENGQKKIEYTQKDNVTIGKYIEWYENGQKKYEFNFNSEGVKVGTYTEWHENGTVKETFEYKNGERPVNMVVTTYYDNGKIQSITKNRNFEGSIIPAQLEEFYENGNKKEFVIYHKFSGLAIRTAKIIKYNEDGKVISILEKDTVTTKSGDLYPIITNEEYDYYKNGELALEYIITQNNKKVEKIIYHFNDKIFNAILIGGKKFGLWKTFFNDETDKRGNYIRNFCDSSTAKYYRLSRYGYSENLIEDVYDYYITGEKYFEGKYAIKSYSPTEIETGIWFSKNGDVTHEQLERGGKRYTSLEIYTSKFENLYVKKADGHRVEDWEYWATFLRGKHIYFKSTKTLNNITDEKVKIQLLKNLIDFNELEAEQINKQIKDVETDDQIIGIILYFKSINSQTSEISPKVSEIGPLYTFYPAISNNEIVKLNDDFKLYSGLWYSKDKFEKGKKIIDAVTLLTKNFEKIKNNDAEISSLKLDFENKFNGNKPNKQIYSKGNSLLKELSEKLDTEGNSNRRIDIGTQEIIPALKKLISLATTDNTELNAKLKSAKTSDEIKKLLEL